MLSKKNLAFHGIAWGLYLSILYMLFEGRLSPSNALLSASILWMMHIVVAYLNSNWLIPNYLQQKKYLIYVLVCLILISSVDFLHQYVTNEYFRPEFVGDGTRPFRKGGGRTLFGIYRFTPSLYLTIILILLSSLYKLSKISSEREKEGALLRSANLASELNSLRSQINPHFLFNALNNLYALSEAKSPKMSEMILKLSDILRYNLYDEGKPQSMLIQEVSYISNYVDFFSMRIQHPEHVTFKSNIQQDHFIYQMILIPFIENAFKHSKIENEPEAKIDIELESDNQQIHFRVTNSFLHGGFQKDEVGGIGIQNVRRRLEILYKNLHTLSISESDGLFTVDLRLLH